MTNGGGGSGDPRERDPEAVRDDVIDGFVSSEAARQIYGVVLRKNGHLPEVDTAATRELRANLGRRDT